MLTSRPRHHRALPGARPVLVLLVTLASLILPSLAQAGWSTPAAISDGAIAGGGQFDAVTSAGGITTAVWVADGKLMFARSSGAVWPTATVVDASAVPAGIPVVALMPDDDVLALWAECPSGSESPCTIFASEYAVASSTWSTPDTVATNAVGEGFDVSVAATGLATIAWVDISNHGVGVATGEPDNGGVWSWTPRNGKYENGFARSLQVVSDSTGGAMVAWHCDGFAGGLYARRTATGWSATAERISLDNPGWGEGWTPAVRLGIGPDDVVTAIWNEISSDNQLPNVQAWITRVARFDPAAEAWGAPTTLTPADHEGFNGDVAVAADGTTTAVWAGNDTLNHIASQVYASTYDANGGTWSTPVALAPTAHYETRTPRALGTDHGALVTWDDDGGSTWVNLNRSGQWDYPVALSGTSPVVTVGGATYTDGLPGGAKVLTSDGTPALHVSTLSTTNSAISAPLNPTVAPDFASLAVSWQPPSASGAWGVETYTAVAAPGGRSCTTAGLQCTITGLDNDAQYAVTVSASTASGSQSAAPVAGTPVARDGWVGALTATTMGGSPQWDGLFGTAAIGYSPSASRSLVVTYVVDGSGPGYVTTLLNGDGSATGIADGRIPVDGPNAYWSGSPAVQANPATGGWIVAYYAGPAGENNGATCGNSDGTETAGAVRVVTVAADGTIGTVRDAASGICAAGTLSAQWDAQNQRFLVAGSISTATGGRKLRGRLVGADGVPTGNVLTLASFATDPQADLAYSTVSNRYLAVVYAGGVAKAVMLDAAGAAIGGVSPITFAGSADQRPSVAYDVVADQFVVVWGNADVTAQRVSAATGSLVGGPIAIASQDWTGRPRAIGNPVTGEVLVSWTGTTAADGNNAIRARAIASGATVPSGNGPVLISGTTRTALRPALTFDEHECAYRLAFTAKPYSTQAVRLYTRGFQPDWCSRAALTITRGGAGVGTVTGAGGIDCGGACSAVVNRTTEHAPSVTLTAVSASGSVFDGWTGACSGSATTCTVAMDSAKAVEARFSVAPSPAPSPTPSPTPSPLSSATTPQAAPAAASSTPSNVDGSTMRTTSGGSRQIGNALFTVFEVPGPGVITQVGYVRHGGRLLRACSSRLKVGRAGKVSVRCALERSVVRAAARSVRAIVPVPLVIRTTFVPAGGGTPIIVRSTAVVHATPLRASDVTG
ncbi:MAG: InlB B-repeat-containing protein [Gaiellales bacterium]